MYLLSGKRKMVTYANLKSAFCGRKTPRELRKLTKRVYVNMVQSFAEIVSMTKFDDRYIEKNIKVRDIERIEKLSKTGKGVIFITGHFGNWELNSVVSAAHGYPLYFLGREQKMKRLYALMNRLRETRGNIVIRKGTDIKRIIRVLHDGKIVGMAADQNAGASGELLYIFGRLASTAVGPFRIAERTGAHILPVFIHRVKGPRHELVLEEHMDIKKGDDIIPFMKRYNALLEKHVSAHPDQWLWMHKRWKMNPERKVMVLDDGKKGHLKQSLAVVKEMQRYRESEGHPPEHIKCEVIKIGFRSGIRKFIFNLLTPFFTSAFQGRPGFLKWALYEKSYEEAIGRYADIIVSCSSSLLGVNRMLKIENFARSIVVLDPGPMMRGRFDLVVVPEHDAVGKKKEDPGRNNLIITELAPNLICPQELLSFKKEARLKSPTRGKINIGLLIGGDNSSYVFTEVLSRKLVAAVIDTCEKEDGYLYATTSRRTDHSSRAVIEGTLSRYERCNLMVSGSDDEDPHTVEKIMAISDVLIVSGESISMVSEAVSSARPVMVFMPEKLKKGRTKYEKFTERLENKGYIAIVRPEDIPGSLAGIKNRPAGSLPPDDGARIREKLYRLF